MRTRARIGSFGIPGLVETSDEMNSSSCDASRTRRIFRITLEAHPPRTPCENRPGSETNVTRRPLLPPVEGSRSTAPEHDRLRVNGKPYFNGNIYETGSEIEEKAGSGNVNYAKNRYPSKPVCLRVASVRCQAYIYERRGSRPEI